MTRPGRPTGPQGARTARLVVRVTPADLAAYQAAAGRAGVSVGEWVRGRLLGDRWEPALAPQPLHHVQQPTRDADGQQHGDEGEGV